VAGLFRIKERPRDLGNTFHSSTRAPLILYFQPDLPVLRLAPAQAISVS
jgi:hypothetical protein